VGAGGRESKLESGSFCYACPEPKRYKKRIGSSDPLFNLFGG